MDTVPASQRVRWTAMESVNQASWAGSAVVGGYLMDLYGVEVNFGATICLQVYLLMLVGTNFLIVVCIQTLCS